MDVLRFRRLPGDEGQPQTIDDLVHHDCLVFSRDGQASQWSVPTGEGTRQVGGTVRLRANTIDAVLAATRTGCGVAWLPTWAAQPHVRSGELVPLLTTMKPVTRPVFALFTHQNLMTKKVRSFIDYAAARLENMPWAMTHDDGQEVARLKGS